MTRRQIPADIPPELLPLAQYRVRFLAPQYHGRSDPLLVTVAPGLQAGAVKAKLMVHVCPFLYVV